MGVIKVLDAHHERLNNTEAALRHMISSMYGDHGASDPVAMAETREGFMNHLYDKATFVASSGDVIANLVDVLACRLAE